MGDNLNSPFLLQNTAEEMNTFPARFSYKACTSVFLWTWQGFSFALEPDVDRPREYYP
jgi:hypothetical protein